MSVLEVQAKKMLNDAGLYCTAQRTAILKAMIKADGPLRQDELAKLLGKNYFDKVTIYRTLNSFANAGIVHHAFVQKRTFYFELARNCSKHQCHPHFTCTSCGQTECLIGVSVPAVKGLKKGLIVHRQQIQLEGLCSQCNTAKL